ncbi:MAG: TIGR01777 family oxidoreductase, partial [Saprospiraceae bacterium]
MNTTVLIAGGSGLVGRRLQFFLKKKGYAARVLTRTPRREGDYRWNPASKEIDPAALEGVGAIVNLAGAGIADKRWTEARKREIVDSRVLSARTLVEAISAQGGPKAAVYIGASAIGLYGDTGDALLTEESPPGVGFMPECCMAWEAASRPFADALGLRSVLLRIGIVLSMEGGALPEVLRPARFGLGVSFGDGRAWWSWIHIDDLCRMIIWAIENAHVGGVYHAVAPAPERNKALIGAVGRAMGRALLPLPAPSFALRILLGEMSAVVLN